ncbi:MAG: hypothetical protein JSW50_04925 [Candidatus Latescibacterota bacterium]|nr:MAG: hypothetical protein JSW50_04925 [Candidatus Latescibacterota bacterium]
MGTRIIVLCYTIGLFVGAANGAPTDEMLTDAFLKSQEIMRAQLEAKKEGFEGGRIEIVGYSGMCGAVGCQSAYLVIQSFVYRDTNPRSKSLMALVYVGPNGDVTRVKRVVLADYEDEHETD